MALACLAEVILEAGRSQFGLGSRRTADGLSIGSQKKRGKELWRHVIAAEGMTGGIRTGRDTTRHVCNRASRGTIIAKFIEQLKF